MSFEVGGGEILFYAEGVEATVGSEGPWGWLMSGGDGGGGGGRGHFWMVDVDREGRRV